MNGTIKALEHCGWLDGGLPLQDGLVVVRKTRWTLPTRDCQLELLQSQCLLSHTPSRTDLHDLLPSPSGGEEAPSSSTCQSRIPLRRCA